MRFFQGLFRDSAKATLAADCAGTSRLLNGTYRFVAVDVETANGDRSSICQLGLAGVDAQGGIETASVLVDPEAAFAGFNTQLHGIDARTVRGQRRFPDIIQPLRAFLQRHPLVQHSGFDRGAINSACQRYGLPGIEAEWFDSVGIARRAWPELRGNGGHGLGNLKGFLGLDFRHHDAGEDARAAALVVLHAERHTGQNFADLAAPRRRGKTTFEKSVALDGNRNGPLFGHDTCFTGRLSMSRTAAATLAAEAGITVRTGFSKKITLLVVGDQDLSTLAEHDKSTKHRRAEELIAQGHALRIIAESEFLAMIAK